jgi:hypothetical protein
MTSHSFIWEHFDKEEASTGGASCFRCRKKYKTSVNTSNLRGHLKRAHKITPPTLLKKTRAASKRVGHSGDAETSDNDDDTLSSPYQKKRMRRQTLRKCFSHKNL